MDQPVLEFIADFESQIDALTNMLKPSGILSPLRSRRKAKSGKELVLRLRVTNMLRIDFSFHMCVTLVTKLDVE